MNRWPVRLETEKGEFVLTHYFDCPEWKDLPDCVCWAEADRYFYMRAVHSGVTLYQELSYERVQDIGACPCDLPATETLYPHRLVLETKDGEYVRDFFLDRSLMMFSAHLRWVETGRHFMWDFEPHSWRYVEMTAQQVKNTPIEPFDI